MSKQKIKNIYKIKHFKINDFIEYEDLSIRYSIRRSKKQINYFQELKHNKSLFFTDDVLLNESINNKIKRRCRILGKRNFNDLFPSIYKTRRSWKHNSKREHQFKYSIY